MSYCYHLTSPFPGISGLSPDPKVLSPDPKVSYYLTHKAQELGYKPNLILGARQINNGMSKYIAERTIKEMITHDKKIKNANVLVMGLTFKEDCPDMRNSKVFDIIDELNDYGCNIDAYDSWIDVKDVEQTNFTLIIDPFKLEKKYDAIIIAVGHKEFKVLNRSSYEGICSDELVIIDIKGIVEDPTWRL